MREGAVRSMTFDMIGMALMALMVMLVIGGGTTWAYLAGQRDSHGRAGVPTRAEASRQRNRPSARQAVEESPAPGRRDRHGRRRELFLGP
jgi:hypothetical protein